MLNVVVVLVVGLGDLKGLLQPEGFRDSLTLKVDYIVPLE